MKQVRRKQHVTKFVWDMHGRRARCVHSVRGTCSYHELVTHQQFLTLGHSQAHKERYYWSLHQYIRYIYIFNAYIYSGEKKYLVSHQLCKFSHLKI